jgi:polyferredoxin
MKCHGAGASQGMTMHPGQPGKAEAGHHTMAGLPGWALQGALLAVLLLTVWALIRGRRGRTEGKHRPWRWELTGLKTARWLISRRPFQFAVQLPLVLLLGLIIYAGLYGSPVPDKNAATVLTWTLWWTLLIADIVLLGRTWCLVCPWDAVASWIRRLAFWRRSDEPLSLELKWPSWLRNVHLATILFIGLTWLELGYGVTMSPRATAYLGLLMLLMAVIPALIFERRSFCKYGCLIGRICGLYSLVAPLELRARDPELCKGCSSKDCLRGNERGYPCPTGQYLGTMQTNAYCTLCTECVKSCPEDNVAVNLRPWGADLRAAVRPRKDEATLALVLLSLTSFHGLTMTPTWTTLVAWFREVSHLDHLSSFSVGMASILVLPGALFVVSSTATARIGAVSAAALSEEPWTARIGRVAAAYAYPLIPIALTYHLAHNAGHFLTEAGVVLPVLSDPLGRGADLFGTAGYQPSPLLSQGVIWGLQVGLVLLGHLAAARATERTHHTVNAANAPSTLGARLVPALLMLAATAANLWLLAQPMEMRTGM